MSNTDPESTLEQRIARLEELALAQTQGMLLSHHLMEMEQQKELLQVQQSPDKLADLSQKMRFTERQWERARALSQQLTQELFQSVERRKSHGVKPNVVELKPRRNNDQNDRISDSAHSLLANSLRTRRDPTLATEHVPRQAQTKESGESICVVCGPLKSSENHNVIKHYTAQTKESNQ